MIVYGEKFCIRPFGLFNLCSVCVCESMHVHVCINMQVCVSECVCMNMHVCVSECAHVCDHA